MKAAFIAVLFLAAVARAYYEEQLYKDFVDWTVQHHKVYNSAEAHSERFENFKSNWMLVRDLNRQNRGHFALNKFADMSQEEFAAQYLHPMRVPEVRTEKVFWTTRTDYPTALDWRAKGAVNPVRDQGSCGSCFAFSAVQNIESVYFVKNGQLPQISEQQDVDCERECMIYPGTTEQVCDDGCNGGLPPIVMKYAADKGMMSRSDYPYEGYEQTCKYDAGKAKKYNNGWQWVDKDEQAMVAALNEYGALSVGVCASYWSYYSGGIFNSTCSSINHGVGLVGYGSESGKDYWIVRNSWGEDWGENGYIRLARGYNRCHINDFVSTALPL